MDATTGRVRDVAYQRHPFTYRACLGQSETLGVFAHGDTYTGHAAGAVALVAGMELVPDKPGRGTFDPLGAAGSLFVARAPANGLIVRNLRDTIALCPPPIVSEGEIAERRRKLGEALDETADALTRRRSPGCSSGFRADAWKHCRSPRAHMSVKAVAY
jgi:adenosylmethionine-8-amino-7-oxononanoate aminotransferase